PEGCILPARFTQDISRADMGEAESTAQEFGLGALPAPRRTNEDQAHGIFTRRPRKGKSRRSLHWVTSLFLHFRKPPSEPQGRQAETVSISARRERLGRPERGG